MLGEYSTMSSAKKIHLEGFAEIVEELAQRQNTGGYNFQPMLNLFREMVPLMQRLEESDPTKENMEEVIKKLRICQEDLAKIFEEFCKTKGASKEELQHYFENPRNFPQKEWEEIQAAKRLVEEKALRPSYS